MGWDGWDGWDESWKCRMVGGRRWAIVGAATEGPVAVRAGRRHWRFEQDAEAAEGGAVGGKR